MTALWADDGSLTGSHPAQREARLYQLRIDGIDPATGAPATVVGVPSGFVRSTLPGRGLRIVGMPFVPLDDGAPQVAFLFDAGGFLPAMDRRWFTFNTLELPFPLRAGQGYLYLRAGSQAFSWERLRPYPLP